MSPPFVRRSDAPALSGEFRESVRVLSRTLEQGDDCLSTEVATSVSDQGLPEKFRECWSPLSCGPAKMRRKFRGYVPSIRKSLGVRKSFSNGYPGCPPVTSGINATFGVPVMSRPTLVSARVEREIPRIIALFCLHFTGASGECRRRGHNQGTVGMPRHT